MKPILTQPTNDDWKKAAAAAGMEDQVAGDAIERAFGNQSWTPVSSKAGALMDSKYHLGFEVVWRNDDNTRLVGMHAFRVGRSLWYAPVFFIQGEIRGTDLLYDYDLRKFRALTPRRARRLIAEARGASQGSLYDRTLTRNVPSMIPISKIAVPPSMSKSSSVNGVFSRERLHELFLQELTAKSAEGVGDFSVIGQLKAAKDSRLSDQLLRMFEHRPDFMDAFLKRAKDSDRLEDADVWVHETEGALTKAATDSGVATDTWEHVAVRTDTPDDMRKEAFVIKATTGYWIDDRRPADVLSIVTEDSGSQDAQTIGYAGFWRLYLPDGDDVQVFAAPINDDVSIYPSGNGLTCAPSSPSYPSGSRKLRWYAFRKDGAQTSNGSSRQPLWGAPIDESKGVPVTSDYLKELPTQGSCYMLYDAANGVIIGDDWMIVDSVKKINDSVHEIRGRVNGYSERVFTKNKDYTRHDYGNGALGKDDMFIELKMKSRDADRDVVRCSGEDKIPVTFEHLDNAQVTEWAMRSSTVLNKVTARRDAAGLYGVDVQGRVDRSSKQDMKKSAAVDYLTYALGMSGEDATRMVNTVDMKGEVTYLVEFASEKRASAFARIDKQPYWTWSHDSRFGVKTMDAQKQVIPATTYAPAVPPHRIRDAVDPTMGNGGNRDREAGVEHLPYDMIMSMNSDQLGSQAAAMGVPNVFDHATIGVLAQSVEASELIDMYLPKLEDAVDALGRMIFLYYLRPSDFEGLYGRDDAASRDAVLIDMFKKLDNLVLDLDQTNGSRGSSILPKDDSSDGE